MTDIFGTYRLGGYEEGEAPSFLVRYVDCVWTYVRSYSDAPIPGRGHRVLPEPDSSLCFTAYRRADGRVTHGRLLLMGPNWSPRFFAPEPGLHLEAVRIKAEWVRPLTGISPFEYTNASQPPGAFIARSEWGRLEDRLMRTVSSGESLSALLGYVEQRAAKLEACRTTMIAHGCLERIRRGPGVGISVRGMADAVGVSARHSRRAVRELTAASPKQHQRVHRLGTVVSAADRCAAPSWSRLAFVAGYCDQAHLIRDYRELTGLTPTESHRERRLQCRAD